jgi:hypothetical protein
MGAAMHIPGESAGGDSVARNLGRMVGHIAAAIRTPVAAQPGTVIARRVQQCDAPGPDGTTLRRTVVDEIVAHTSESTSPRDHHAS